MRTRLVLVRSVHRPVMNFASCQPTLARRSIARRNTGVFRRPTGRRPLPGERGTRGPVCLPVGEKSLPSGLTRGLPRERPDEGMPSDSSKSHPDSSGQDLTLGSYAGAALTAERQGGCRREAAVADRDRERRKWARKRPSTRASGTARALFNAEGDRSVTVPSNHAQRKSKLSATV